MTVETTKYVRKPFEVEAVQVTEENIEAVSVWCQGDLLTEGNDANPRNFIKVRVARALNERQTRAYPGDWVLYAGTGFKVYTSKAFHKTFERSVIHSEDWPRNIAVPLNEEGDDDSREQVKQA